MVIIIGSDGNGEEGTGMPFWQKSFYAAQTIISPKHQKNRWEQGGTGGAQAGEQ